MTMLSDPGQNAANFLHDAITVTPRCRLRRFSERVDTQKEPLTSVPSDQTHLRAVSPSGAVK